MHTKFDHYSFSRSRDMVDAHQNLNGSRDLTTPLSFKDPRLALTTIDLYTKFEVIVSTIEIELLFGQVIVLS